MSSQHFDLLVLGGGIVGLWTARLAARAGASVAVVERGPAALADQRDARPALRFAARTNLGATKARNHVLTGNSSYWGGGLVRNSAQALAELYGPATGEAVQHEYAGVERALGVHEGFEPAELFARERPLHEIAVLPGKLRGLWSSFREPGVHCFTDSSVTGVRLGPRGVERLELRDADGREHQLVPREVALSMGVLDSNLFAQQWLAQGLPEALRPLLGTRLHDHWSIAVSALKWRAGPAVSSLFPPKFRSGVVAGRRLALDHGFFHVVADLDTTPPYDRVKAFMRVRQQGAGVLALARAAAATMASPFLMARTGIHYLARHELRIPDGSEVRLVYDFESARDLDNRIVLSPEGATLHWDLRAQDHAHFERVLREHRSWWEGLWREAGVEARWLFAQWTSEAMRAYLTEHALDAYHLGGGLHPDAYETPGVSEPHGALRGCPNVFVNGTAFYCRPGPANPVLTLLARATVYVREIAKGVHSA